MPKFVKDITGDINEPIISNDIAHNLFGYIGSGDYYNLPNFKGFLVSLENSYNIETLPKPSFFGYNVSDNVTEIEISY